MLCLRYHHALGCQLMPKLVLLFFRLTAFVLRSYVKAESFIYIDPKTIEQSKTWLADQQRESGCFLQSGTLFNNRMKVS